MDWPNGNGFHSFTGRSLDRKAYRAIREAASMSEDRSRELIPGYPSGDFDRWHSEPEDWDTDTDD